MRLHPIVSIAPALLCALALACTQAPNIAPPRAFNRPARIELVCFAGDTAVALSECRRGDDNTLPENRTLLALVTQQTRGEVAAVDLSASPPRVIDSDRRVPGYTFVEVGEVPVGLAVSRRNPVCTWVANRGSSNLSAVETARFREESLGTGMESGTLSLAGEGRTGRPHALVLIDDGATAELYVSLPDDGVIGRVPVTSDSTGCMFGELEILALPDDVPEPPAGPSTDPTFLPEGEQDPATLAICIAPSRTGPELATPSDLPVLAPLPDDPAALPAPQPREIEVERDESGNAVALLIGDAARPVIHRYDLVARTFVDGLRTDGPVLDLTLTPPVPDRFGEGGTRRYVYAVDARDGSVMVIDESTGHVVPVASESTGRTLRIPFRTPARAVASIDRRGTGGVCTGFSDNREEPSANNLRGVFVSVALSDGTVRFIDVLDEDAVCRAPSETRDCTLSFQGAQQYSFIRRHRTRIASRIVEPVRLIEQPTAVVDNNRQRFGSDGQVAGSVIVPRFGEVSCDDPDGLAPVFGDVNASRICAATDPWTAQAESWSLAWEGAIPGTNSVAGNFQALGDGTIALDTRVPLCERGVLGEASGAPGYPGDLVAITVELPASRENDPLCRALVGVDAGEAPQALLVPIQDVRLDPPEPYAARIVLRADEPIRGRQFQERPLTVQDLVDCSEDQLAQFAVRVNDRFAVVGSRSGFAHRVIASEAEGRCVVDETQPDVDGRAALEVTYVSPRLRFLLGFGEEGRPESLRDLVITFDVGGVPAPLAIDVGLLPNNARSLTLPAEVWFDEITDRLYILDELRRGLIPTRLSPLGPDAFIE